MPKLKELQTKVKQTFRDEGVKALASKTKGYLTYHLRDKHKITQDLKDVLFINGCALPHPQRYRVDHQIEQLESYGMTCDKVFYEQLDIAKLKYYRCFVFYRCPVTPTIQDFIKIAKENNKTIFYDIDDLVYDTKYTNRIDYVKNLPDSERKLYDDGVQRMGETLRLCDYGITTTTRLQTEMEKILPEVCINRNVASEDMVKYSQATLAQSRDSSKVIMGYFSGSITHNDDFQLIMPTIVKLLKKYDNLFLKIVGELSVPDEMQAVSDKIIVAPFTSWQNLPRLIHSVDINLAPLENSIFNEAKSENKWTEAALVKVPTIASNVGAFQEVIEHEKTGLLCSSIKDWEKNLIKLIEQPYLRQEIADRAYDYAMENYITTYTGKNLADFISSKLKRNFFFVLPTTNVSGGVMVAVRHALTLKHHGYDVTILNSDNHEEDIHYADKTLLVVSITKKHILAFVDTMVATLWTTLEFVRNHPNCLHHKYLVQGFETDFLQYGKKQRRTINSTYNQVCRVEYLTISKWCEGWLSNRYHNQVKYAPNGIDLNLFTSHPRDFKGKIKILIEGDSKSYYKNTDESFKIAELLDRDKYEIHYLSYDGNPKKFYRYDEFHHKVPYEQVHQIYSSCDILIKTSILESFSYPPLEMMATGGFCVVAPNEGNVEYLKDNTNCLFYKRGDIEDAAHKIELIANDPKLRAKLAKNAKETVASRDWNKIEKDILALYE